jgi:hypothetical protein
MDSVDEHDGRRDRLPIAVRGYARYTRQQRRRRGRAGDRSEDFPPSNHALIFDTETTNDARQQLRFGVYQLRDDGVLVEEGLFYDPIELSDVERSTLYGFAARRGLEVRTAQEFVDDVFYCYLYDLGALCIGFNLPFDLSRLALGHGSARRSMRGGFSLRLSEDPDHRRVRIRHLYSRTALMRLTPPRESTPRSQRIKGQRVPKVTEPFLDLRTLAGALLGGSWSLASLAHHLQTEHQKLETDEHGDVLTKDYLRYAVNDVQVTWECFDTLRSQYDRLGLSKTPITQIYSEASLGKAYLREMGTRQWRRLQPRFRAATLGVIMSTYYGGRAEVRIRRRVTRVMYCDFLSMYPTVCTLMGLWRFVIAQRMQRRTVTAWAQHFLETVTAETLQDPGTWQSLAVLVQVHPDDDLFPVRAPYDQVQRTIGLNHLKTDCPLWYTLADCATSTILTGKVPRVLKARRFDPVGVQEGLESICVAGNPEYRVDPVHDDFYRRLIDLRREVKEKEKQARRAGDHNLADRLKAEAQALKLCANATSYGIFVELNVSQLEDLEEITCHGYDGEGFPVRMAQVERPGTYFHPLLGTLITGAARMMLALAEYRAEEEGLGWVFCDTDSMAFANPDDMDDTCFQECVGRIVQWFAPLNPYSEPGSILKIEDANYAIKDGETTDQLLPAHCFAVSAKRYVLFNLNRSRPVLRKVSAHGLGHLLPPYKEDQAPRSIPEPIVPLKDLECERWHHDLWYRIVEAALGPTPEQVRIDDLPAFDAPAVSRYSATTPALLRWFREYNGGKAYRNQVRPFGFLLSFPAASKRIGVRDGEDLHERREEARHWLEQWRELRQAILHEGGIRPNAEYTSEDIPLSLLRHRGVEPDVMADQFGYDYVDPFLEHVRFVRRQYEQARGMARRRRDGTRSRPVAPFNRDPQVAALNCFDRLTGEPVHAGGLRSYAASLAQYHLSPEHKFLNGDYLDSGVTHRRHVVADTIEHIGKEADKWEEQFYLGLDLDAQIEYGTSPDDDQNVWFQIVQACQERGVRAVARGARVSHTHLRRLLDGRSAPTQSLLRQLRDGIRQTEVPRACTSRPRPVAGVGARRRAPRAALPQC